MFAGGASINDGVVFDLRYLNQLMISEDKTTAFVGPGNRWGAVYSFLDTMNLTVVGGRVSGVGVGGYLLGGKYFGMLRSDPEMLMRWVGGISYISKKYGWGCDNVRNYEVVLANGSVTNINQKSDPDLYW
jgi:FAD/FMN-containing dehydrogenase